MKRLSAFTLALMLVFGACTNARLTKKPAKPSPSATGATTTAHDEAEEERHRQERLSLGYSVANPPPKGFIPASKQSPPSGHLTMEVQFEPTCVEQGESTRLTAKTNRPNVRVSFITTLENESGRAVESDGSTDSKGLWTWEFKVEESSPAHTYEMLGASIDEDKSGEGNSVLGSWLFVVGEPGQCS